MTPCKATIWKRDRTGVRFICEERGGFPRWADAKQWADRAASLLNRSAAPGVVYESVIGEEDTPDALTHLKAVVAAYREPHYGDKDTQLDNVHTAVEAAEIWLKEQGR